MSNETPAAVRASRAATVVVVGCLFASAGCALDVQDRPVPLDPTPSPEPSSTSAGRPEIWSTRPVSVFLVHDGHLLRVNRRVVAAAGERPALVGVMAPVSETEAREGLRNALPSPSRSLDLTIDNRTATVGLPTGFDDLEVSEQILGVGQIVYTLTADGTVDAVRFSEGSHTVAVPNGSGRLVDRPVDRSDYGVIAPVVSTS